MFIFLPICNFDLSEGENLEYSRHYYYHHFPAQFLIKGYILAQVSGTLIATGMIVVLLPFEGYLDIEDNNAGSKLPEYDADFFGVFTMELVGTLFLYFAFLFIHSPESKQIFDFWGLN